MSPEPFEPKVKQGASNSRYDTKASSRISRTPLIRKKNNFISKLPQLSIPLIKEHKLTADSTIP